MTRAELATAIGAAARLEGHFQLRSGRTSTVYWDKYRFESQPDLLSAIAEGLETLVPPATSRLAGLELGGVPLATALSLRTRTPCLFVRKAAKPHGTMSLVEGGFERGDRVLVVEDVITSGGQVCESIDAMRRLGLVVEDAVCVIDREQDGAANLAKVGCTLRALFRQKELEPSGDGG
jgi:orotate phosphoribosyltransferase